MTTTPIEAPNSRYTPLVAVSLRPNGPSEAVWGEYKLRIHQSQSFSSAFALSEEDARSIADTINDTLGPLVTPSMKTELEQLIEIMCEVRWDEHMKRLKVPTPRAWADAPAENRIAFREAILPMAIAAYNFLGKRKGQR